MVCKIEAFSLVNFWTTLYVLSHIQSCTITLVVHPSITSGVRMMSCSQAFPNYSVVFDNV